MELFDTVRVSGERTVMATLVRTKGTTPRKSGARMFVAGQGRILGSVTIGGCVDTRIVEEAEAILGSGVPRLLDLQLGDEEAWEIGLTCGGTVEVFLESVDFSNSEDPIRQMYEAVRIETQAGRRVQEHRAVNVIRMTPKHYSQAR